MRRLRNELFLESDRFPFHIGKYTVAPRKNAESHSHEFIELVYISSGSGLHEFQERSSRLSEGDLFVIEPELQHRYLVEPGEQLQLYNILFHPSLLDRELQLMLHYYSFVHFFFLEPFFRNNASADYFLHLGRLEKVEVEMLIERMHKEYSVKALGYEIRIRSQLIDLLIFLSRCYDQRELPAVSVSSDDEHMIQEISHFIKTHYAQDFSLQQISRFFGMSQSSFVSKFKKYTGRTFIEYRNDVRMQAAVHLLETTTMAISEIALEVGFHNFSHFNKLFRKTFNASPKLYRKM